MSLKTIVFDLDGTLLDTLEDLAIAVNRALELESIEPCPVGQYRQLVGSGARNLMINAASSSQHVSKGDVPDELVDRLLTSFNRLYQMGWAVRTRPYPGVPDLLERLKSSGVQMAILSNKPDDFTKKIAAHYFPDVGFRLVHGKLKEYPIKPDPSLALEMLSQLETEPQQAMLVGDSGSDMKTARRAGMAAVGVLWGFREAEELKNGGAQHLLSRPDDLLALVRQWGE